MPGAPKSEVKEGLRKAPEVMRSGGREEEEDDEEEEEEVTVRWPWKRLYEGVQRFSKIFEEIKAAIKKEFR